MLKVNALMFKVIPVQSFANIPYENDDLSL